MAENLFVFGALPYKASTPTVDIGVFGGTPNPLLIWAKLSIYFGRSYGVYITTAGGYITYTRLRWVYRKKNI